MKYLINILIAIVVSTVVFISGYSIVKPENGIDKVGFVSVSIVYDAHPLKIKYEKELKEFEEHGTEKLDSLSNSIMEFGKIVAKEQGDLTLLDRYNLMKKDYKIIENQLSSEYQKLTLKYKSEIMEKVNKAVDAYGKKNNYKIIVGATGDGALMYGDENADLTEDIKKTFN